MVKKGKSVAAAEASASKKRGASKITAAPFKYGAADPAGGSVEPQTFPWARSQISDREIRRLKMSGVVVEDGVRVPGAEVFLNPPHGWRVVLLAYFLRGLQFPMHPFLCGLLFTYGIQLSQLTPNSLLHLSVFITLCECFLGIHPHFGLFKMLFYVRRFKSGMGFSLRNANNYFLLYINESVTEWRKKWLYVKDSPEGVMLMMLLSSRILSLNLVNPEKTNWHHPKKKMPRLCSTR